MVALHGRKASSSNHEEAEQDHDGAANKVQLVTPLQEYLPEGGRRGAKYYEDCRKPKNKAEAQPDDMAARGCCRASHRSPRDIGDVAWHEWQNAGRDEGYRSRQ